MAIVGSHSFGILIGNHQFSHHGSGVLSFGLDFSIRGFISVVLLWHFVENELSIFRLGQFWMVEIGLIALLSTKLSLGFGFLLIALLGSFFLLCLIANRALYDLRPHPSQLTAFYLIIAFGGWIGGMLVSTVAPLVFVGLQEYPITVIGIVLLSLPSGWFGGKRHLDQKGISDCCCWWRGVTLLGISYWEQDSAAFSIRNFYGIFRVIDYPGSDKLPAHRILVHGKTIHGSQFLDPGQQGEPLAYFYNGGALEEAMSLRNHNQATAMICLGAGDALAWFKKGEDLTVCEIDPDIERVARDWFIFIRDSRAHIEIQIGKCSSQFTKWSTGKEKSMGSIMIDAFSGDGIPLHLITLEALNVYLSRLSQDGIMVFHIFNEYYDLIPVLKAASQERGLEAKATTYK